MKPEHYTDEDLRLAILDASDQRSIFISTAYELEDIDSSAVRSLRTLLAHLPEPATDEWQECRFEDIRKGDRVSEVVKQDDGTTQTIEGVASYLDTRRDKHSWKTRDGFELALDDYALDSHLVTLYRIPAPIQHPDPKKHPVILEPHTTDDEVFDYAVWDTEDFYLCHTHEGEFMRGAEPSEITKFTPAKVVEDDR